MVFREKRPRGLVARDLADWGRSVFALCCLCACSNSSNSPDDSGMGGRSASEEICSSDAECRDGLFCNGDEVCDPLSSAANDLGCRRGIPPCGEAACDEESLSCVDTCPDQDEDGHANVFCGGDDCDDADPDRFPGNPERCDQLDQDCDPTTVGNRDEDDDGSIDMACCNGELCGQDCDDQRANVSRLAPEVCDGVDNDCDGQIDNGVLLATYPDLDFDGFGDTNSEPELLCQVPFGSVTRAGDCDDTDDSINPALEDICDGRDTDCDGTVDDGADQLCMEVEQSAVCIGQSPGETSCRARSCPTGHIDCDGDPANGCEVDTCSNATQCGACGYDCGGAGCGNGLCQSGPAVTPAAKAGWVVDSETGAALSGVLVEVADGGCPTQASWTSAANGSFSVSAYSSVNGIKAKLDDYWSTRAPLQDTIPLFSDATVSAIATELGIELDKNASTGIAIIDMSAGLDLDVTSSSPHGTPRALSGLLDGGDTQRVILPGIAPGTTTIELAPPEFNCSYFCDGATEATVYIEAGQIIYLKMESCFVACVG